ncbi:hypothetical protein SUGI_0877410 [Cryptomeria japonica]|nr:hypothetical protein SUGI_0877410 [Cryptomeria japonica]
MEVRYMIVDSGTSGKAYIRGLTIIKECQNNLEGTKTTFLFGWFHSGLIVYINKEGYLFLIFKIKESIHHGVEKISPSEVDAVLLSPLVVAQTMAFGVPNDQYGEEMNFIVFSQENMMVNKDDIANLANQKCFKLLVEMTDEDYRFLDFMLWGSTNDHNMFVLNDSFQDGGFIFQQVNDLSNALFSAKGSIRGDVFDLDLF